MKSIILPLYLKYRFLQYDSKNPIKIGFFKKIWAYRHGFFRKNYILYNLENNDYRNYVSDFQENFKASRINTSNGLINNKVLFTETVKNIVEMPKILGIIEDGKFIRYGSSPLNGHGDLIKFIHSEVGVILKPVDGDGGLDIYKIEPGQNSSEVILAGKTIKNEMLEAGLKHVKFSFISPLIKQHSYSNSLYPYSINTIRIILFKDVQSGKFFIGDAAHRIGNNKSKPVDNCGKGGFTAPISIEDGTLGKAVRTYFEGKKPTWFSEHPDTGGQIEGVQVPEWEMIKSKALELSEHYSFMEYIGWDIVLQPNNNITLFEANDACDLKLHQVHKPLLSNERIKRFYQRHNVV